MVMGRPKKNSVDYFPHDTKHGKTIKILKTKHGNDGVATWWAVLELLGCSEGHYYDCREIFNWEFLLSETLLDGVSVTEILNTLSLLGAIDAELWEQKILYSQNFVNRISDVYGKRGTEIPRKPEFLSQKTQSAVVSVTESAQSKVKEIKEKKIKVKEKETVSLIKDKMARFSPPDSPERKVEQTAKEVIDMYNRVTGGNDFPYRGGYWHSIKNLIRDGVPFEDFEKVLRKKLKDYWFVTNVGVNPNSIYGDKFDVYLREDESLYKSNEKGMVDIDAMVAEAEERD